MMNHRDKLKELHDKLSPLHKVVFKMVYKVSIDEIEDDQLEKAMQSCEKFIEIASKPKSNTFAIPTTITSLPNVTINTNIPPKEPQFCLCGSRPYPGDIFYYQSKYALEPLAGEVAEVHYDTIRSKNGTSYKFSEIRIKPKYLIREEKINKLFNDED